MAVSVYISQTQTISLPIAPPNYFREEYVPPEEDTEEDIVPPEECEPRQITEEERFVYKSIGCVLDTLIMETKQDEEQKASCDYCCQACTCSPSSLCTNPFSHCRSPKKKVERETPITPVLHRGRSTGWKIMKQFPLVNDIIRDVWVTAELVLTLIALALAINSFRMENNRYKPFHIAYFTLALFSAVLAIIDTLLNLMQCRSCKKCCKKCGKQSETITEQPTKQLESETSQQSSQKCCRKCTKADWNNSIDMVRMLLSELLLYPLLVFDMFEFIVGKPWKSTEEIDKLGMALFIISLTLMVFYVYIMRFAILFYLTWFVDRQRKPVRKNHEYWSKCGYDESISKSASCFQRYFFVHVFGQMVGQILILVTIGAKIQYDNRTCDEISCLNVSGFLWFMLASGYVLPVFGVLTFFIVTYYWVQEFPIGLCVDVLRLLQMSDVNTLFYPKESTTEIKQKVKSIAKYLKKTALKQEFRDMHNKAVSNKFLFPFKSPCLIVLSIIYSSLHLGFIICTVLTFDDNTKIVPVVLNEGLGWTIFFGCAIGLEVLANIYVFAVAALWVMIIAGIIVLLTLIISGLLICCFLAVCLSSDSNKRNY